MNSNLNILLVDDHLVVRKGIELIINDYYPNATIYNAENYPDAIEVLKSIDINLVVLDIIMNGIENVNIMKEIRIVQNKTKILIFSCHEEEHYGLRYVKNGADGYLHKYCSEDKIIAAFKGVLSLGYYYSDEIKLKLKNNRNKKLSTNPIDALSNREFEVAKMLIDGCGNLEIANKLNIQMSTVSTYKNRVFEKLDINNIVALSSFFKQNIN
ncbi:response regulator [Flavobacterium sp.]|uniref:response regulator n=1 Tax=Flavobacterium sp. TaxID=239 RepID=UPI003752FDD1